MIVNHLRKTAGVFVLGLALASCGTQGFGGEDAEELDAQLLGEADNSDPALTAALEDQIMVDPELTNQSNQNAALPGDTVSGSPVPDTMSRRSMTAQQRAAQTAISEGRLLSAPAAREATEDDCPSCDGQSAGRGETTLGAMAANQQEGESCANASVDYDLGYADRMPAAFRVYPRSEISEAAGNDTPGCRMRVVSFRSGARMQRLLDWYHTRAVRSGYSSEHLLRHGNNVLGGYRQRDEGAYYIIFAARADGGTDVDIVTNNGR